MKFKSTNPLTNTRRSKDLGGNNGVKAPANIAGALGVGVGVRIHPMMLTKLFNHPDMGVSSTAKRLYSDMSQRKVKASKSPY